MKFNEAIEKYLNERLSDVKPKEGEMHKLLGIDPDDTIIDKYSSGKKLAADLLKAVNGDKKKAASMLAYAANIDSNNNVLDDALAAIKEL